MKLDGSIAAVVTGGASGLGEGTARAIAATGAKVALFDLNEERGEAIAAEIGGVFCKVDVTDDASVAAAFAKAAELQPMNGEAFYQWAMACHHAHQPEQVAEIAKRLAGFEPKRALKLIKDAERPDLKHLVPEEVRRFFEGSR